MHMIERIPGGKVDRLYVSDKDPDYYYRWCNQQDANMMELQLLGFRGVEGEDPLLRSFTPVAPGQSSDVPGGAVRRRGDLVLMRVRKEVFEQTLDEIEGIRTLGMTRQFYPLKRGRRRLRF